MEGIRRIRLGSLDPDKLTDRDIARMAALPKLCPQFHLSLQSGCSKTLRAMRRPYTAEQYAQVAEKLRAAFGEENVSLTTDVIVGFPGETEEDFLQSMAFVQAQRFLKVHVFPYSRRAGTPAYDFPDQIPEHEKEARSRRMTAAVEEVRAQVAATIGRPPGRGPAGNAAFRQHLYRLHQTVPAGGGVRAGACFRRHCDGDAGRVGRPSLPRRTGGGAKLTRSRRAGGCKLRYCATFPKACRRGKKIEKNLQKPLDFCPFGGYNI